MRRRSLEDLLGLGELLRADDPLERLRRADPFFGRIHAAGRFELLARAVVEQRADVRFVPQPAQHAAGSPAASAGRKDAVVVETFGDSVFRVAQIDELVEDPLDDGHLSRVPFDQRHPLVLDALPLPGLERMQRFAFFVQQQSVKTVGR